MSHITVPNRKIIIKPPFISDKNIEYKIHKEDILLHVTMNYNTQLMSNYTLVA